MDRFFKMAFLFSLLAFLAVFSKRFVFSRENNRIEGIEKESIAETFDISSLSFLKYEEASDVNKETIEAKIIPDEIYPGEVAVLKIKGRDKVKLSSDLLDGINLYPDKSGGLSALIPVKYDKAPGKYTFTIEADDVITELVLKVLPKEFPSQNIEIDEEKAKETVENKEAEEEYNKRVQALKWNNLSEPLWEGKFSPPLENYRLTSDFGEIRKVNGKESGRHGGIDLAAPAGTPVYAPANGKVIFADFLALTGNTVMIEHGMGLKTLYYHLDSIEVNNGDEIKKGDMLGKVGNTGFSTGPHLHFAAAVENIYINPWSLFEKDIKKIITS